MTPKYYIVIFLSILFIGCSFVVDSADPANAAPVITSASSTNYAENSISTVITVTSTDEDSDDVTYSISGTDADDFSINSNSGALTFVNTPNYESPTDADGNNTYIITVTVTDNGSLTDSQTLTVTVNDENDFCEESNLCLNGSECVDLSETYGCFCTEGWSGVNCEISNSPLVGEWEFYFATAYTNLTCSGDPFAQYYTSSPAWLALFPGNLSNYELTVTYNSDLTITQTQTTVSGGNIEIDIDTGSIIDSGTEKCVTWDEGSSSACESCSPYTINGDTLVTTNYCAGIYPCQKWTSIRQY